MISLRRSLALLAISAGLTPLLDAAPAQAAGVSLRVSSAIGLNVRSGPSLANDVLRRLPNGARLGTPCGVRGQGITGTQRTTRLWLRLSGGGYVSDAYVARNGGVAVCATGTPLGADAVVNAPSALNVRSGPTTAGGMRGRLSRGSAVQFVCQRWGQPINGDPIWYALGKAKYVARAYLRLSVPVRPVGWCGQQPPIVPRTNQAFIAQVVPAAQRSHQQWGVPASVTIAQAILESGWGRSTLTMRDHNYFGMKCFGNPGKIAIGCSAHGTHECDKKRCFPTTDSFRVYRNPADSFSDHGRMLATYSRYSTAMRYAGQPARFAAELQRAGYATSPTYAAKLVQIMGQYKLYKYNYW